MLSSVVSVLVSSVWKWSKTAFAVLFGTTADFLDRMGWHSLDELPPLAPHLPGIDALDAL